MLKAPSSHLVFQGKRITKKTLSALKKLRNSIELSNDEDGPFNISSQYVDIIVYKPRQTDSREMQFYFLPNFHLEANGINSLGVVSKVHLKKP